MHILGCFTLLLFLVVVLLMLAPVILLNIVRKLFGTKQKPSSHKWERTQQGTYQQQGHASSSSHKRKKGKKFFNQGEGEYVDFEEIKE